MAATSRSLDFPLWRLTMRRAWFGLLLQFIVCTSIVTCAPAETTTAGGLDQVLFLPAAGAPAQPRHIVLISGDEEYRSEESLPMLGKIFSHKYGIDCTILFSFDPDGSYIDPNHQEGLRGLERLQQADLMIIATRFRRLTSEQATHITEFLNAGKPVIGLRTATHAFAGDGTFGETLSQAAFGRRVLGEEWVCHHGQHKVQGCRAILEPLQKAHPVLRGVRSFVTPSDTYGVTHLTADDTILLRGAVTESLAPDAPNVRGPLNEPPQPLAWLHRYTAPNGSTQGQSFCTTAGASVDFLSADLRRLIVNAALFLLGQDVPAQADVDFVDPFYPSFYGFIEDNRYWERRRLSPADFGVGKTTMPFDPPGSPTWPYRPQPASPN